MNEGALQELITRSCNGVLPKDMARQRSATSIPYCCGRICGRRIPGFATIGTRQLPGTHAGRFGSARKIISANVIGEAQAIHRRISGR